MLEYLKKLLQDLENLNRYIENRKQKKISFRNSNRNFRKNKERRIKNG